MVFFDYVRTPAAEWGNSLSELKTLSPQSSLGIHIFWGDHEALPGVRDFHSKSKLKLEKLFKVAQTLNVNLHIRLGFTEEARSFPAWSRNVEPKALVSAFGEGSDIGRWEYQQVPTLRNQEFKLAFRSFIEEVATVLSLYLKPNGPIQEVSVTLGSLESDSSQLSVTDVSEYFTSRYQTIERFNNILQTSFSDFSSLASSRGLKTFLSKRVWLACWDYKAIRKKICNDWKKEIESSLLEKQIPVCSKEGLVSPFSYQPRVWMDDTLLEVSNDQMGVRPLTLQGELDPAVLTTFRVAEMLKLEALSKSERIGWLGSWDPSSSESCRAIICSKFLSSVVVDQLKDFISNGGRVFFPFGIPSWNENLEAIVWGDVENRIQHLSTTWELKAGLYDKINEVIGCPH